MKHYRLILIIAMCSVLAAETCVFAASDKCEVSGELKKWHKVTLTFTGPETGEAAQPNPFRDYRLSVTFIKGQKQYIIPGYYAADGTAAETSAKTGNKWRVHFVPDETGSWTYAVSFRTGPDIALMSDPKAGSPAAFDGVTGTLEISASDKTGRDHRAKGLTSRAAPTAPRTSWPTPTSTALMTQVPTRAVTKTWGPLFISTNRTCRIGSLVIQRGKAIRARA